MEPTPEFDARREADRAASAEKMTFGQRLLAGPELFDLGLTFMRAGIRMHNPGIDDNGVEQIVVQRLRAARQSEERV
jgi:hypothetical protein